MPGFSYLLADDLSGALEAGAAFRARGWSVTLSLAGPAQAPAAAGLEVVSSETRNAPAAAAGPAVRRLLAERRAAGGRLRFKKIDSTLRGPVGAELRALVDELAPPLVVVCPATPAVGRTVRAGVLCVRGVPVAETEFRRDPGWPSTESRLAVRIREAGAAGVAELPLAALRAGRAGEAARTGGVLASDAETDADLRQLVESVLAVQPAAVFVGAGGLAHALAAVLPPAQAAASPAWPRPATTLFVSGSMNDRSRRQLEKLRDECGVPLHEVDASADRRAQAVADIAATLAVSGAAAVALTRSCGPVDPASPVAWLREVVTALAARGSPPELLVATGGETAQALCASLDIRRLDLLQEAETGVVLTAATSTRPSNPKWVVIKPGGFGSDSVWANLRRSTQVKS
ncbi:MAG: four-carbon acid sugar kinase family protein [Opitutaceae bacterium]|nr:four-carbon acid sugar kinase family protein [Opitutaceae bacterium]